MNPHDPGHRDHGMSSMDLSKRVESILVGAACLVYVGLRLWRLADSCFWFDEIFSIHAAEHTWAGLWWFVAQDLIHPPLFYALLKVWISIGGDGLLWLRLFPVFCSVLALGPFLLLCKELRLEWAAKMWALVFLAVNGAMIKYAQEVRMYGPLLFLSTVSIWLFARFFYKGKNIWLLTLTNVLLVYTHYYGWFVILAEVVLIFCIQRVKTRHVAVMFGIVAAAFAPWAIAVLKAASSGASAAQNIGWIERPAISSLMQFAFDLVEPFYFQQSSVEAASNYLISIPMLLVIVAATIAYFPRIGGRANKTAIILLSTFVLLPVLLAMLISWLSPLSVWGSRHLTIAYVPASILCAMFFTEIRQRVFAVSIQIFVVALITAALALQFAQPKPDFVWCAWNDVAESFRTEDGPDQVVVFEDLVAYHIWFALRKTPGKRIFVVNDAPGVHEDKAYFLPRGFGEVGRITLDQVPRDGFWMAFRSNVFDPAKPPFSEIIQQGFIPGKLAVLDRGGQQEVLVEMKNQAAKP